MNGLRIETNGKNRTFIGLYEKKTITASLNEYRYRKLPPGKFIVFEGSDCCGKSTQLKIIAEYIRKEYGRDVVTCFDPGSTAIGAEIRHMLKYTTAEVTPATEILLFAAARQAMNETIIRPALKAGKVVLCDRYIQSSIIYQIFTKNLRSPLLHEQDNIYWNSEAVKILIDRMRIVHEAFTNQWPAQVFVFDINEDTYNRRRELARSSEQDRFENDSEESKIFMREVRRGYQMLCQSPCPFGSLPGQYVLINGNQSTEEITKAVKSYL